jgi:hypothetical protein
LAIPTNNQPSRSEQKIRQPKSGQQHPQTYPTMPQTYPQQTPRQPVMTGAEILQQRDQMAQNLTDIGNTLLEWKKSLQNKTPEEQVQTAQNQTPNQNQKPQFSTSIKSSQFVGIWQQTHGMGRCAESVTLILREDGRYTATTINSATCAPNAARRVTAAGLWSSSLNGRLSFYPRTLTLDQQSTESIHQPNPVDYDVVLDGSASMTMQSLRSPATIRRYTKLSDLVE